MKLYSYIVVSDNGYAPNPTGGVCTLAYCKWTLRRVAQPGDYIVGLAGREYRSRATTEWPIVYAMRVTGVCNFDAFRRDERYRGHVHFNWNARAEIAKSDSVLTSDDFVYWGGDGPALPRNLTDLIVGRAYKCNFLPETVTAFIRWFEGQQGRGCLGTPYDGWFSIPGGEHGKARRQCRPAAGAGGRTPGFGCGVPAKSRPAGRCAR